MVENQINCDIKISIAIQHRSTYDIMGYSDLLQTFDMCPCLRTSHRGHTFHGFLSRIAKAANTV